MAKKNIALNTLDFDKSFHRLNGQPLDANSIFDSLDAAKTYATTETSEAYVGQYIAVKHTNDKYSGYIISDTAGTLIPISSDLFESKSDNLTISQNDNGKVTFTISGNIQSASTVKTQQASTNANYYLAFVDSDNKTATAEAVYTASKLKVNPSAGDLTAGKFNGATITSTKFNGATITSGNLSTISTITFSDSENAVNTDNRLTTKGKINAGSFNAYSDARLKENFQPLTSEKSILDLPCYKFDFINGSKNQIGCKAQDLQEICPEIVNEGSDGYLSIQESKIIYLLLEEVKKLREELNELKGV